MQTALRLSLTLLFFTISACDFVSTTTSTDKLTIPFGQKLTVPRSVLVSDVYRSSGLQEELLKLRDRTKSELLQQFGPENQELIETLKLSLGTESSLSGTHSYVIFTMKTSRDSEKVLMRELLKAIHQRHEAHGSSLLEPLERIILQISS